MLPDKLTQSLIDDPNGDTWEHSLHQICGCGDGPALGNHVSHGDEPNSALKWAFLSTTGKLSEDPPTRPCTPLGFSCREPGVLIYLSSLSYGAKSLQATNDGYI